MTNMVVYFGDSRFEVDVKESIQVIADRLSMNLGIPLVPFERERGGTAIVNRTMIEYVLLTEGGGEND